MPPPLSEVLIYTGHVRAMEIVPGKHAADRFERVRIDGLIPHGGNSRWMRRSRQYKALVSPWGVPAGSAWHLARRSVVDRLATAWRRRACRDPDALSRIAQDVTELLRTFRTPIGSVEVPFSSLLLTARKTTPRQTR